MSNTLDDLFEWAAEQPPDNETQVQVLITSNELTKGNVVSYVEGTLWYHPAKDVGASRVAAYFASQKGWPLLQYFSTRRYPGGLSGSGPPFNTDTDPQDVTIQQTIPPGGGYLVTLKSPKWGVELSFESSVDPTTGIVYGVAGTSFDTLSLCNKLSEPAP